MFALTESRVDAFIMCDVKQCFWFVLIFLGFITLHDFCISLGRQKSAYRSKSRVQPQKDIGGGDFHPPP